MENDITLIGVCGLNCFKCNIYQAYSRKDIEAQRRIVREMFGEKSDVKPEQITCEGCRGNPKVHWSADCKILTCSKAKGAQACSQCTDFPCPTLDVFYTTGHKKAKANALRQKEIGLEAWWNEQSKS